jgi:hypothetical protein
MSTETCRPPSLTLIRNKGQGATFALGRASLARVTNVGAAGARVNCRLAPSTLERPVYFQPLVDEGRHAREP